MNSSDDGSAVVVGRNVGFALLGAALLVLKGRYAGPGVELVRSYGGNVVASFAVYFILATQLGRMKWGWMARAAAALGVVELFEATDGFGVMSNTYDAWDFAANGVGVTLALVAEAVAGKASSLRKPLRLRRD
jgi:hypothetical protein